MIYYDDPAYAYPVTQKIRQHVFRVFGGEEINEVTMQKVKDYLERTVPGSAWKVTNYASSSVNLRVQFETEQDVTAYMLRWA